MNQLPIISVIIQWQSEPHSQATFDNKYHDEEEYCYWEKMVFPSGCLSSYITPSWEQRRSEMILQTIIWKR